MNLGEIVDCFPMKEYFIGVTSVAKIKTMREWCRENLQVGWLIVYRSKGYILLVNDDMDFDLAVIRWGKSNENR